MTMTDDIRDALRRLMTACNLDGSEAATRTLYFALKAAVVDPELRRELRGCHKGGLGYDYTSPLAEAIFRAVQVSR